MTLRTDSPRRSRRVAARYGKSFGMIESRARGRTGTRLISSRLPGVAVNVSRRQDIGSTGLVHEAGSRGSAPIEKTVAGCSGNVLAPVDQALPAA